MFELAGSQFEKGVLELRLEKPAPRAVNWLLKLGPIRARLILWVFVIIAGIMAYTRQPSLWMADHGILRSRLEIVSAQTVWVWSFVLIGFAILVLLRIFRVEKAVLRFSRSARKFTYVYEPYLAIRPAIEGGADFKHIRDFKVYSRDRDPKTPYGFVEIGLEPGEAPQGPQSFRFKLLSEEQFRIYPTNMARIMERPATGDWSDPDEELANGPKSR